MQTILTAFKVYFSFILLLLKFFGGGIFSTQLHYKQFPTLSLSNYLFFIFSSFYLLTAYQFWSTVLSFVSCFLLCGLSLIQFSSSLSLLRYHLSLLPLILHTCPVFHYLVFSFWGNIFISAISIILSCTFVDHSFFFNSFVYSLLCD